MTKMRLSRDSNGILHDQFWFNPKDNIVYTTSNQPDRGFISEIDATPIYNAEIASINNNLINKAKLEGTYTEGFVDSLPSASLDGDLTNDIDEFDSHMYRHRVREAALLSTDNPAVNVVRIFSQLFGLTDRPYAGVELMRRVPTEELILNFDRVLKMEGMEEIPEMTMPRFKNIEYERQLLETKKFGLVIRISDESIRKNVHNPFQDSVTVAGTKVQQRKAFDVINALINGLTVLTQASQPWDDLSSGTFRSTNDPTRFINAAVTTSIEGTNVGGKWDRMGIHQIGAKVYETNTYLNGIVSAAPTTSSIPGTKPLAGFQDVTMVMDQFIPQGNAIFTDVASQSTGILLEGPTRIATKVDEFLNTQNYGIFDHHVAAVLNRNTGFVFSNVYTPITPPVIT